MKIVRPRKPRVWQARRRHGYAWFITWPRGDISSYRSFESAIAGLDRWIERTWPKQRALLGGRQ